LQLDNNILIIIITMTWENSERCPRQEGQLDESDSKREIQCSNVDNFAIQLSQIMGPLEGASLDPKDIQRLSIHELAGKIGIVDRENHPIIKVDVRTLRLHTTITSEDRLQNDINKKTNVKDALTDLLFHKSQLLALSEFAPTKKKGIDKELKKVDTNINTILDSLNKGVGKLDKRKISVGDIIDSLQPRPRTVLNFVTAISMAATAACSPIRISTIREGEENTKPTLGETLSSGITLTPPSEFTPTIPILTKTPTTEPTETPTPTETQAPTATPTEIPVNIYYSFEGREEGTWKLDTTQIPEIPLEDITSGKLNQTEVGLMAAGKILKFSEQAIPYGPGELTYHVYEGIGVSLLSPPDENNIQPPPETLPYKLISLSFTEVNGTKLLVLGVANKNFDGSISVLHYAFQNYTDPFVIKMIKNLAIGKYYPDTFGIVGKSYTETFGWYNYNKEKVMLGEYQKEVTERVDFLEEWQSTGNVPQGLTRMLLLVFPMPWNPWAQ